MIRPVLGSRASIGGPLGSGRGGASLLPDWAIAGGVSAANVIACYQPKGAASYVASKINLANPGTYDAIDGALYPTFDTTTGWTFNATNYLVCPYVAAHTGSIIVRVSNLANTCSILGTERTAGGIYVSMYRHVSSGVAYSNCDNGTGSYNTPSPTSGVLAVAGRSAYRNGSAEANGCSATTGTVNQNLVIGGRYAANGAIIEKMSGIIQAVAIYDAVPTGTQIGLISAAMAAL